MVWRMAKRGQLIAIAVSIAILLSAFGLPATANGPQNSGQTTGLNLIPYFYNSSAMGAIYLNFTKAELELLMPPVMLGNLSIPGIIDFNNMSYFVHTLEGPYVFNTTLGGWKVYGFTFVALPTYGNGSVVNPTYMLQKTMIIAYNGEKVIVLLYYRNLAPVPLELNQYWSHIHKGVDGLYFTVLPDLFNPYANATEQVIQDAYYIDGNTSLYVNGSYLGQLNSFGLWQVLPVGPITLINNASGWYIQLIPINNLSTTQQIQLISAGLTIDNVTIANSFFNIQHAEVTLMPNQSAQYVYSIGINTQPPNYTEISGILSYLLQIASSFKPQNTSSSSSLSCSRAAVLALRQILGDEYQVGQFIGANSSSLSCLYFGTVNGQLYELSSRLYFIEPPGINSIVLYPPGSSYWNGLNSNLYVLQLMPDVKGWSNDNLVVNSSNVPYSGGNYTVILVGTYTQYSWTNYNYPADGFYVSMFVKPVAALVNKTANYTIPVFKLVESQTPYLIVGWDPISAVWPVGPGEFDIAVVYPNGTYVTLLDEGGQGYIQGLEPGDLILMKVTYDSYTNAIYAEVVDLNSSSEINITFPLGNYFTPPQPGYYWTSVYSWSGWEAANWGIVYYAVSATTQQTPTPPTPPTLPQNYQVILNLLNGQQYFGVPHVYQGDNDGSPTNSWPVYLGPNNASQYWSLAGISSNQPVLELVPQTPSWASGAMFWSETYSGGLVKITSIGTQTNMGNGFIIYLFLKPTKWSISPQYNYTIPYNSTAGEGWLTYAPSYPSRVEADVIYPQSSTPYIIVQWDPVWQFAGYTQSGATGQWNVWIVSNPSGNNVSITPNPSPNLNGYSSIGLPYAGWDGIGTGAFQPNPGDRINITVTYNSSTNTLTGIAIDLNTGQSANFTLNLGNYYTPPSSGNYVFGVGATGPHWALLYVAMIGNVKSPSPSPTYYSVNFTEVGLPPGTAWNVTLNGVTKASSSSSIIFTVPNGEYNYSVASPILVNGVEYVATKPSGTVTVNNTNVTITVQYVPVSTTEKLEVYSQFVKYFYSGFNLPNRFFVAAPSINGNQPSNVTGYIVGANVTLSFTYNPSSGYWVSNEVNMGVLKPGSYELTVYAVYGNNYVVEGTYSITVLEPPPIVLTMLSYIPIPNQAFELKLSNLGEFSIPLSIGYEWSLEKNITGLFNNTYEIEAEVILEYELKQNIPVNYLSGKYSILLEFPIPVTLDSNGTVSIGGGISKNLVLQYGPANAAFTVGGSAQGNLAISSYRVVLQTIDALAFLSAYGTYNIPTPWAIPIDDMGVIGFTVSISLGASAHVKAVLIPVNNSNSTIPLAFKDVSGNVFIPFGIEGSLDAYILGVGAAGGLQGAAGVGFLLQPGGSSLLESPGGAMVGEVNAFAVVNLIIWSYQGSWTTLGPGVLYKWGSVPNSAIVSFEDELQQAAQQFQWQVIGSDWINGSVFGIINNNTRFGYGYSITSYNGLVYIYYTELTPSGVAVVRGLVFNGTTAVKAPLPVFNDLGEASPLLVMLSNGSLMMIWAGVPMGHYGLNNLTILLQASVLHGNTWGPVVNLTTSGDAMSYASDGKYIYLVYEPKLTLTYNNTILEELTPTGVVVRALSIPGVVGITGAWNGLVIVQFINGTYALVNMNTGVVEPINASIAGFSSGLLYYFYNGTLTVVNGTQRLAISLPNYAYAFPVAWSHGLVIIAWRPGLLSVFNWNGTVLQPIRNYTTAFTIIPRASIIDNTLYLTWFALENITNGHGSIYMAIQPLPHPTNQSTTTTTTTVNVATTPTSVNTSTSSVTTPTTSSMTNSVKPSHSALPTWVAAAVAVIVVLVLIIALLMSRRSKQ